jgi:hypothetical protein
MESCRAASNQQGGWLVLGAWEPLNGLPEFLSLMTAAHAGAFEFVREICLFKILRISSDRHAPSLSQWTKQLSGVGCATPRRTQQEPIPRPIISLSRLGIREALRSPASAAFPISSADIRNRRRNNISAFFSLSALCFISSMILFCVRARW